MALNDFHRKQLFEKYAITDCNYISKLESEGLLSSLTPEEINKVLNRDDVETGGLCIKYPNDPETFTIRLDKPLINDQENEVKYLRPAGQENRLYIPLGLNIRKASELWVTEGELKAVSMHLRGQETVALSGIWNWLGKKNMSKINDFLDFGSLEKPRNDADALIKDFRGNMLGKKVILIYDSDITRTHQGWDSYCRLAEQLYRVGAKEVKIITCPKPKGEVWKNQKAGLDDLFVAAQTSEELTDKDVLDALKKCINDQDLYIPMKDGSNKFVENVLKKKGATEVEKLNAAISVLAAKDDEGLREFIGALGRGYGYLEKNARKKLKQVMSRQRMGVPLYVSLSRLKKTIQQVQTFCKNNSVHREIDKDKVYELIIETLKKEGTFFNYYDNNNEAWYFCRKTKQVMEISSVEFETFFTYITGLSIKNEYGKSIVNKIYSYTCTQAEKQKIHRLSYYDKEKHILYLDLFNGDILKLDGQDVQSVPMGTNNVYLATNQLGHEWTYTNTTKDDEKTFLKLVLGSNYCRQSKLRPEHARLVDLTWKLSILFREIQPTKPILLYNGGAGSGKSNAARIMLKILLGETAEVSSVLQNNQDQIATILTNQPVVCIDNLDSNVSWMLDLLATAATGGKISKRVLYTTNKISEYAIISRIVITSRTPKLHRDDIAERLLTLRLVKLKKFIREEELLRLVHENRNRFLSILTDMANQIIRYMKTYQPPKNDKEQFRLADFAAFMRMFLGSALGQKKGDELTDIVLKELGEAQAQFYIEEDSLIMMIKKLLDAKKIKEKEAYKSKDLLDLLNNEASLHNNRFRINSTRALNSMIEERIGATEKIHQLLITQGNTKGNKTYKFSFMDSGP